MVKTKYRGKETGWNFSSVDRAAEGFLQIRLNGI